MAREFAYHEEIAASLAAKALRAPLPTPGTRPQTKTQMVLIPANTSQSEKTIDD